ncbi:coiled-coil domain-containing protein 93 [Cynoglossus semilaevis]|uniref:coiled-coil domain-containing protein 93 n=1 Tax=Cynoglossus semilaevis TaxID=244447 RepID=UPI000496F05C|nr:coiled-coil domain-containing protein 93 [Cynoglossus semilaevis]
MAATCLFPSKKTGLIKGAQYDQEGKFTEVETREDEEQNIKLAEILELLLAAGYFRARIKGLSSFDKVVGGMTWCITTCNFGIDVDLLFQENSTICQKIALTEKIVSVLPKMKCPHSLEPHQIQGLDFIHIFPVIQWLVKRAIETRKEMGDYVRAYSISQFQKTHWLPEDEDFLQKKDKAVLDVLGVYKPERKYRRQKDAKQLLEEESLVYSTLLEYGKLTEGIQQNVEEGTSLPTGDSQIDPTGMVQMLEEEDMCTVEEGKLTASAVGQIVGLQSNEIKLIASEYAEKQSELRSEKSTGDFGFLQQYRRVVSLLMKQIQQKSKQLQELKTRHLEVKMDCEEAKKNLVEEMEHTEKLDKEFKALQEMEGSTDSGLYEKLRALVTMNRNLNQQEQDFRTHCREEMVRIQANIEELNMSFRHDSKETKESNQLIDKQYNTDRQRLQKTRLIMARKNREIAVLQRKIDEVPTRDELTQYQKRFIELYCQVSVTHKETKQFFTLYNTLDDKKIYLEKEVNLLNSIHDNFQQAMSSSARKEQFLRQMEQIVEGIKQSRVKMEKKKQDNKMRRDQLNDEYLEVLDRQRIYFKTVKDFKEECRRNEMLLSKLNERGAL